MRIKPQGHSKHLFPLNTEWYIYIVQVGRKCCPEGRHLKIEPSSVIHTISIFKHLNGKDAAKHHIFSMASKLLMQFQYMDKHNQNCFVLKMHQYV